MAVDPIGAQGNNSPTIHFRPDPGEPAVRLSAPANQTAQLVTGQEQRNETRLRSRALVKGDEVIFSRRSFTPGVEGGDLAVTSGLTTVSFREGANRPDVDFAPPEESPQRPIAPPPEEGRGAVNNEADAGEEGAASPLRETREDPLAPSSAQIARKEDDVEREKARVEIGVERAEQREAEAVRDGSVLEARQARAEKRRLELEKRQLDRQKSSLQVEKQAQRGRDADANPVSPGGSGSVAGAYGASDPGATPAPGRSLDLTG